MLTSLRQFLTNEEGSLGATHLMLVATILVLGAALSLVALDRAVNERPPTRVHPDQAPQLRMGADLPQP